MPRGAARWKRPGADWLAGTVSAGQRLRRAAPEALRLAGLRLVACLVRFVGFLDPFAFWDLPLLGREALRRGAFAGPPVFLAALRGVPGAFPTGRVAGMSGSGRDHCATSLPLLVAGFPPWPMRTGGGMRSPAGGGR